MSTDIKPFTPSPQSGLDQPSKQKDRRTGKQAKTAELQRMENYQGSTNQLGIFDQPEPRHQLLLDNRQRLRGLTSFRHRGHNGSVTTRQRPGQQGSQSQKLMVALPEMLHEGGQTEKQHSEAIVPLLSTQHTGTLTNQTSLSADRLVVKEQSYGVQCV